MSTSIPKKQFEVWFRRQLFVLGDKGPCVKVVLRRVSASKMGQEVLAIDVPQEEADLDDNWVDQTLLTLEGIAQADADGCGVGVQKYMVQSYHQADDRPTASFTIRMSGDANDDDELFSEPPTKQGLLAQLMRHNEAIMRSAAMTQGSALATMQKVVARQEAVIDKLVEEKFDNISTVEELLTLKQERELEAAKAAHKMEMQDRMMGKAALLLPTIVNKWASAGKGDTKLLPEKVTPVEQQLASFADSVTEDQLGALQQIFTPEQLMVLVSVLKGTKMKQDRAIEEESPE